MVKVGFIDYFKFDDLNVFNGIIEYFTKEFSEITQVISGFNTGGEYLASEYAYKNDLGIIIHGEIFSKEGNSSEVERDRRIVDDSEFVEEHGEITTVISGGANGVDALAEEYARENNIHLVVHYANWENGRSAGPLRNTKIVADSDYLIAFLSDKSKGTLDTIRKAEKKGILLKFDF